MKNPDININDIMEQTNICSKESDPTECIKQSFSIYFSLKYQDAGTLETTFFQNLIKEKKWKIHVISEKIEDSWTLQLFNYNNSILLYNSGNHFQYIIPETTISSGGGKRKTQRKRPKSSHKNKSIKTK